MRIRSRSALAVLIPILAVGCGNSSGSGNGGNSVANSSSSSSSSGGSGGSSGSSGSSSGGSSGSSGSSSGSGSGSSSGGSSGSSSGSSSGGSSGSGSGSSSGGSSSGSSSGGGSGSSSGGTADGGSGGGSPTVHLDQQDQTIEGFGINDMYQSTNLPNVWDANASIGLSILRVGMDTAGAGNLESPTSMANDIAAVTKAGGKVIGSVWTPPMNCKTNVNADNGGQLCAANNLPLSKTIAGFAVTDPGTCTAAGNQANADTTCYMTWAQKITSFATTNKLFAMSLANEPEFASCGTNEPCNGNYATAVYTANEMTAFAKIAGPMLQNAGIKVIAPETSEWNHLWSNNSACGSLPSGDMSSDPLSCGCAVSNGSTSAACNAAVAVPCAASCTSGNGYDYGHNLHADSAAWKAIDIIGTHEYDDQTAFAWPSDVLPKDKEVWMTEMAGVKWWPNQGSGSGNSLMATNTIADGLVVAQWIHSALVTGEVSAWLWWWYQPLSTTTGSDNEGLVNPDGTITKRFYALGNYSKFIRPNYVRVQVSGSAPSGVLLSAYSGSNTTVVVAINNGMSMQSVPIGFAGGTAPASCTPWLTSATSNLVSQTAVAVSGGTLTASLAAQSITSYVCK